MGSSIEKNKKQIAESLHDSVVQNLALCQIKLTPLISKNGTDSEESETLKSINELINASIEELRSLSFQLSPPVIGKIGLDAGLWWLCETMKNQYQLPVLLKIEGEDKTLKEEMRLAIFRMIREILMNAVKHSKAKVVKLEIDYGSDRVRFSISDDGVGMQMQKQEQMFISQKGFGLFSIWERVTGYGGKMVIDSEIGQGLRIKIEIPLQSENGD